MCLPSISLMFSPQQKEGWGIFSFNSLDFFRNDPVEMNFLQLSVYLHILLLSCLFAFFNYFFSPLCDFWLKSNCRIFSSGGWVFLRKGTSASLQDTSTTASFICSLERFHFLLSHWISSFAAWIFPSQINSQIQETKSSHSRKQQTPRIFPLWEEIIKLEFLPGH